MYKLNTHDFLNYPKSMLSGSSLFSSFIVKEQLFCEHEHDDEQDDSVSSPLLFIKCMNSNIFSFLFLDDKFD